MKNTDDHLRNHGFILGDNGWKLSPAYDINTVPTSNGLSLNISDDDNSLDLNLAMEVTEYFRLNTTRALEIIQQVQQSVSQWRFIAKKYGLSKREQELMSLSFVQPYLSLRKGL